VGDAVTVGEAAFHRAVLLLATLLVVSALADDLAPGSNGDTSRLQKYIGSYDTDALLEEPAIRTVLEQLLGAELGHFRSNLDVRGSVDLISGSLSLIGNAVHGGGLEEAVLCVAMYDGSISAAIFSEGFITIYSQRKDYDAQSLCIKDWITQVNSGHRDRFVAPANVRFAPTR